MDLVSKSKSDAVSKCTCTYHCVTILVVIIVRIVFIHSFLFERGLCNHSFKQTQTVLLTALNIYSFYCNYTAPASLLGASFVALFAQLVRFKIEKLKM